MPYEWSYDEFGIPDDGVQRDAERVKRDAVKKLSGFGAFIKKSYDVPITPQRPEDNPAERIAEIQKGSGYSFPAWNQPSIPALPPQEEKQPKQRNEQYGPPMGIEQLLPYYQAQTVGAFGQSPTIPANAYEAEYLRAMQDAKPDIWDTLAAFGAGAASKDGPNMWSTIGAGLTSANNARDAGLTRYQEALGVMMKRADTQNYHRQDLAQKQTIAEKELALKLAGINLDQQREDRQYERDTDRRDKEALREAMVAGIARPSPVVEVQVPVEYVDENGMPVTKIVTKVERNKDYEKELAEYFKHIQSGFAAPGVYTIDSVRD